MKHLVLLFFILSLRGTAFSQEKMDLTTHGLLIQKLTRVLSTLEEDDSSKNSITLRLADIYAERARLTENNEKQAKEDRLKALDLYKSVFEKLAKDEKSKALSQMAHLYELTAQSPKAISLYKKVIAHKKDYDEILIGQSYIGLGDMYFSKVRYRDAVFNFKKALEINETNRHAFINSRLAWAYIHQGKLTLAIATMKSVLTSEEKYDNSFREEASRDLATFMAKTNVTPDDIKSVSALSPENVRKDNLIYLATELDRLGKKKNALEVWKIVGEENKIKNNDIEDHFKLAQLQYDVGNKSGAVSELEQTLNAWKSEGCKLEENCGILKSRIRKLVTDWAAAEERAPSALLIHAYNNYLETFPDMEMSYWAAASARLQANWKSAIGFYHMASHLALEDIKKSGDKKAQNIFEGSCLGEIEVGELSKDINMRSDAYENYLAIDPQGPKTAEVRYQKVHLVYEEKRYAQAALDFHALAIDSRITAKDIREKSADLSIESLISSKDETNLPFWAQEYAGIFEKRGAEFQAISRRAVLNREAKNINDSKASTSDLEKSLVNLNGVSLSKANEREKRAYFKNRLILAEKLKNLGEVQAAADALLSLRSISKEDRELALSRKAWVAEMQLNFALAYDISRKMKMPDLARDERLLQLAMLAELAGQDSEMYDKAYIKISKNEKKVQIIVAKLVRRSSNPELVFKKYQSKLRRNPSLYTTLALESFSRGQDYTMAAQVLRVPGTKATEAGQALNRIVFLKDFDFFSYKFSKAKLSMKSSKSLKRTLEDRLYLLHQNEHYAQRAIRMGDWTLQAVTLDSLSKQYFRLGQEILNIKAPRGLNRVQANRYKSLIAAQASPYFNKSRQAFAKTNELWKLADFRNLESEVKNSKGHLRALAKREMSLIVRVAPQTMRENVASRFAKILNENEPKPAQETVLEAKQSVRENPFNPEKIESLKVLEEESGNETIVAYLDMRLAQLQGARQ